MTDQARSSVPAAAPADAVPASWVARAPASIRPYLQLSRFDRPAGFWLLGLPCPVGIAFARIGEGFETSDAWLVLLFAIGAIAMRGAGCTWNDFLDRDIDAKVARTALRPIPAGAVTPAAALVWMIAQCFVGLLVLLALPTFAQAVALGSIPLVALYPLMKRITWWPQVWLGLTFNWGVLVAVAAVDGAFTAASFVLYGALILWTLGYDTIYALQDREDDALIGVRSTARRFGSKVREAVRIVYALCAVAAAAAGWMIGGWQAALAVAPFALHLAWQSVRVVPEDGGLALRLFKSNREAGLLLFLGWAFVAALN